eukprot:scaffold802_cov280-Pinguiococcus_pyrenoidosus.AAC.3
MRQRIHVVQPHEPRVKVLFRDHVSAEQHEDQEEDGRLRKSHVILLHQRHDVAEELVHHQGDEDEDDDEQEEMAATFGVGHVHGEVHDQAPEQHFHDLQRHIRDHVGELEGRGAKERCAALPVEDVALFEVRRKRVHAGKREAHERDENDAVAIADRVRVQIREKRRDERADDRVLQQPRLGGVRVAKSHGEGPLKADLEVLRPAVAERPRRREVELLFGRRRGQLGGHLLIHRCLLPAARHLRRSQRRRRIIGPGSIQRPAPALRRHFLQVVGDVLVVGARKAEGLEVRQHLFPRPMVHHVALLKQNDVVEEPIHLRRRLQ